MAAALALKRRAPRVRPPRMHPDRLDLVATTLEHITAELERPEHLARMLGCSVPPNWPPGEYDRDALVFFHEQMTRGGSSVEGWYGWYAIHRGDGHRAAELVGVGGYFGPPDPDGSVEIGYSIVPEREGRGFATELARALVKRAMEFREVARVIAHTTAENPASIIVLERCGFRPAGAGAEEGALRFEHTREGG